MEEASTGRAGNADEGKRQTCWKALLADAAIAAQQLKEHEIQLWQLGCEENARLLTMNLGDLQFLINARMHLGLPILQHGLCQHQRGQKSNGMLRTKSLAHLDGRATHAGKLPDRKRSRATFAPTSSTTLALKQVSNHKGEVTVPALSKLRMTKQRVDIDGWRHAGLPLDPTIVDANARQCSSAISTNIDSAPGAAQAERAKETRCARAYSNQTSTPCSDGSRPTTEPPETQRAKMVADCCKRAQLLVALAGFTAATILSVTGNKPQRCS